MGKEINKKLFGVDLFGDANIWTESISRQKFLLPPISVLDRKNKDWMKRRKAWLDLGIKGEERGEDIKKAVFGTPEKNHFTLDNKISVFDPVLTETMYEWFCPKGGTILDPFAGGSVRGIVASVLGYKYIGIELREKQVIENYNQSLEILRGIKEHYNSDELTPVQKMDGIYLKRDDLSFIFGLSGGKVRSAFYIIKNIDRTKYRGITTAGSRLSPQVEIIAILSKIMGFDFVAHIPEGNIENTPIENAIKYGAKIIQHPHGYNSVIKKRSREFAEKEGYYEIPFGMESQITIDIIRKQVKNIPRDVKRIVVPVGSGMTLAGILWGMKDYNLNMPVIGIKIGGEIENRLNKFAPSDWKNKVKIINLDIDYHKKIKRNIGNIELDPIYEAKCVDFLQKGDLFWIIGKRLPNNINNLPIWLIGDSTKRISSIPKVDFVFSCPPYGNLEIYSNLKEDLSNMKWEEFLEKYKIIIKKATSKLKDNRFACFVISNYRDTEENGEYRNLYCETIKAFESNNLYLYNDLILLDPVGTAAKRGSFHFKRSRKMARIHQNILVFMKGDHKKAVEELKKSEE